jgi:hypothetical protein
MVGTSSVIFSWTPFHSFVDDSLVIERCFLDAGTMTPEAGIVWMNIVSDGWDDT